jgi:glutamate/tyrosine decarboxylase-like PLP-dependent enzyme
MTETVRKGIWAKVAVLASLSATSPGLGARALASGGRCTEIMLRIQESGVAVLTDTTLRGRHALRVAICNHRTRTEDLDLLVAEVPRVGRAIRDGQDRTGSAQPSARGRSE